MMNGEGIAALIQAHIARYPEANIWDVYKLLHQATFGPGHVITSKKAAREWLEQEMSQQVPTVTEPLIESIHPDDEIVRFHLRPYLGRQGKAKPLLEAMVRSADEWRGDPAVMAKRWQIFDGLCQPGRALAGRFDLHELALFGRVRAQEQWPAVHHSPAYISAYHPAYRVLIYSEAKALCDKLGVSFEVL